MSKNQMSLGSWVIPIILLFIFPEVGGVFIFFKVLTLILGNINKKPNDKKRIQFEESDSEAHDIDFSHDHEPDYNRYSSTSNKPKKVFDTETSIKCHTCNAENYVSEIPSECEYCGSLITKI